MLTCFTTTGQAGSFGIQCNRGACQDAVRQFYLKKEGKKKVWSATHLQFRQIQSTKDSISWQQKRVGKREIKQKNGSEVRLWVREKEKRTKKKKDGKRKSVGERKDRRNINRELREREIGGNERTEKELWKSNWE